MNCRRHPDRAGVTSIYAGEMWLRVYLCKECADAFPWPRYRAFGTGTGPEAHAEAQEAGRMDKELQEGKTNAKVRKYL